MPELPDITVYIDALRTRLEGRALTGSRILSPFLLRTAEPPLESLHGAKVVELRRLGKRIAIGFDNGAWLVFHLMIAGRFAWFDAAQVAKPTRQTAALFEFESGTLLLREAGSKKRASLHVVRKAQDLRDHDRGGIDVQQTDSETFAQAMRRRNHTLKRALTDPSILSGIGNAYSDEILHRARLSPIALTQKLDDAELFRLHTACREILAEWTQQLRQESAAAFPAKVTAFRDGMAVHGRYGKPCPRCGTQVQRIRYASNETNYCPRCQTDGRLLADRSLSRLLKKDWPRSMDELERRRDRQ
jgi:formamidopyrimidine-DNA glycosylase